MTCRRCDRTDVRVLHTVHGDEYYCPRHHDAELDRDAADTHRADVAAERRLGCSWDWIRGSVG